MKMKETSDYLEPLISDVIDTEENNSFLSYISQPENEVWKYIDSSNGYSLLHILMRKHHFNHIEKVLKKIKEITEPEIFLKFINHQDNRGFNVLLLACAYGNMNLIKLLLEYGIDYKAKTITGLNCIHLASQANKVSNIYYLYKKYKFYLYEEDNNGNNFFHWACHCGSEKVIDFFLNDITFKINEKNREGIIPLHYYIDSNKRRSIKRLVHRGADPYMKDNKGKNGFDRINKIFRDDKNINKELKDIWQRNFFKKSPFILFIFFLFIYVFFIIIFEFPFIGIKSIHVLYRFYLIWTSFVWIFIFYFLNKSPGIVKQNNKNYLLRLLETDNENNIDLWYYCIKCQIKKEIDSRHCFICDKCIKGWDHHCIWLKRCIGNDNKKAFYYLIIIILINSIFNLIICLIGEKSDVITNIFIFSHILINNIRVVRVLKILIFAIYFIFTILTFIVIIPLVIIYMNNRKNDNFYYLTNSEKIIGKKPNINENDEKDNLIIKNDNE